MTAQEITNAEWALLLFLRDRDYTPYRVLQIISQVEDEETAAVLDDILGPRPKLPGEGIKWAFLGTDNPHVHP